MARLSIDEARNLGNFQHMYRWNMRIIPPAGSSFFDSVEALNHRCESAELPQVTNQKIQVDLKGHSHQEAGIADYSKSISMSFVETTPHVILDFIYRWQQAIWASRTGVSRSKNELYATIEIDLLNVSDEPVGRFRLYNTFVEAADPGGTVDGASSDALKPNVTFSFDYFEYEKLR